MIVHDFSTMTSDILVQAIIQDYRVLLYRFIVLIVKYIYLQGLRTRAPGGPPSSVESASRVRGGVCA